MYRTYNFLSHGNNDTTDHNTRFDIALQHLFEGTIGHKRATLALDRSFLRPKRPETSSVRHDHNTLDNHLDTLLRDIDTCDLS